MSDYRVTWITGQECSTSIHVGRTTLGTIVNPLDTVPCVTVIRLVPVSRLCIILHHVNLLGQGELADHRR